MTIYRAICLILFISLQHSLFLSNNSLFTYFSLNKTLESSSEEVAGYQISNKKLRQEIKEIRKDKSFIIIEGKQKIRIYNKQKKVIKNIYLNKSNLICWIPKNTYYDNVSLTTRSIHIESLAGPFDKDKDRTFL